MSRTVSRAVSGGIERGPLPYDPARSAILITMFAIAIYQCLVVNIQLFFTFKRRKSLYFWSLVIASWGIISHSIGVILKWFVGSCPWAVNTAFASFGWWGMVTGQSLVLYSRLHLVVRNDRLLRCIFGMIVVNFCIFQVPTTILTFGSNQLDPGEWLKIYNVYERIQLVVFTLQESVISIIYIRAAVRLLEPSDPGNTGHVKRFLIYVNVLCIVLDIAFVAEVYSGEWVYKTGTQSLAYGTKLTIEFVVLNKLLDVVKFRPGSFRQGPSSDRESLSAVRARSRSRCGSFVNLFKSGGSNDARGGDLSPVHGQINEVSARQAYLQSLSQPIALERNLLQDEETAVNPRQVQTAHQPVAPLR